MKKKRRHAEDALQHTYKITRDGGVLFYRREDHLVYYTLQSVLARKHRLRVLGSSHMYTHVHEGSLPEDLVQLSAYEHDLSSTFARNYNRETGRSGALFDGHFGSAPKKDEKKMRSCMIYIFNNPVEKKLVKKAREDRWTFLPYYVEEYPFSRRPVIRYCRKPLVDAIHIVEHEFRSGRYLKYNLLHHLFSSLNGEEKEQLTDFIIQRYFFFDRKGCEELFDSIEKMIASTELTTGQEFEVQEALASTRMFRTGRCVLPLSGMGCWGPGYLCYVFLKSGRFVWRAILYRIQMQKRNRLRSFFTILRFLQLIDLQLFLKVTGPLGNRLLL